ncbi:MAG: type II toxin-antitoxin system ParD family antitoxin [Planctomycetaceae bacterium]
MVAAISTELEEFVQSELANGHFASRDEVVAAALRQMRDRQAAWEQDVRNALAEGDDFPGEAIVLETREDFRAYAESVNQRGRERLAKERGQS